MVIDENSNRTLGCDFVSPDSDRTGLWGFFIPHFPVRWSYPDFVRK